MVKVIHAVYENGVFRPIEAVDLPEHSNVEFELRLIEKQKCWPPEYFLRTAGVLQDEEFNRADQGELPDRSDWQWSFCLTRTLGFSISKIRAAR